MCLSFTCTLQAEFGLVRGILCLDLYSSEPPRMKCIYRILQNERSKTSTN